MLKPQSMHTKYDFQVCYSPTVQFNKELVTCRFLFFSLPVYWPNVERPLSIPVPPLNSTSPQIRSKVNLEKRGKCKECCRECPLFSPCAVLVSRLSVCSGVSFVFKDRSIWQSEDDRKRKYRQREERGRMFFLFQNSTAMWAHWYATRHG